MDKKSFNNPFAGVLEGFEPLKENLPVKKIKKEEPALREGADILKTDEISEAEKERIEKEQREKREDEELFAEIMKGSDLEVGSKAYWRIRRAITNSRDHDVQFDFYRGVSEAHGLFWVKDGETQRKTMELIDFVIRRGYRSTAKQFLESTLPEKMKHGTYTKKQRIEHAEIMARKAHASIEELAREVGIEL